MTWHTEHPRGMPAFIIVVVWFTVLGLLASSLWLGWRFAVIAGLVFLAASAVNGVVLARRHDR